MHIPLLLGVLKSPVLFPCPLLPCTSWNSPLTPLPLEFIFSETYYRVFWTFACDPVTVPHSVKTRNVMFGSSLSFLAKSKLALASAAEVPWFLGLLQSCPHGSNQPRNPFGHQFHRRVEVVPLDSHLYCGFCSHTICRFLPHKGPMGTTYSLC